MIDTALLLLLSVFYLKSFFCTMSINQRMLSLILSMGELNNVMAPLSGLQQSDVEQGGRGWMTRSEGDRNLVNIIVLSRRYDWPDEKKHQ